ncbi:MAG: TetR/AcrR family transcriptional regulator [Candidatus Velthaea sp.]
MAPPGFTEGKRSVPFTRNAVWQPRIPANAMAVHRLKKPSGRIPAAALAEHEAALLEVARKLFYESGFTGTSIDAVARAARVSPKTIYARFGNKEGLFDAALSTHVDGVLASLRAPIVDAGDVRVALFNFATRLLSVSSSPEALVLQRLLIAESARFPELCVAFFEAGPKRGLALLAELFANATAAGHMRVLAPDAAAEMFIGALLGTPIRAALIVGARPSKATNTRRVEDVVALFMAAYGR